jgi:hypothetical protein
MTSGSKFVLVIKIFNSKDFKDSMKYAKISMGRYSPYNGGLVASL